MVLLDYSNKLARFSNLRVVGGFNTHTLNSCDNDDDNALLFHDASYIMRVSRIISDTSELMGCLVSVVEALIVDL